MGKLKTEGLVKLAIKTAQASDTKHRVGAVLMAQGVVVSKASNKNLWSSKVDRQEAPDRLWSLHAEVRTILSAVRSKALQGRLTLVVARLGQSNEILIRLAKPCLKCQKLIEWAKIDEVYWTEDSYTPGIINYRNATRSFELSKP